MRCAVFLFIIIIHASKSGRVRRRLSLSMPELQYICVACSQKPVPTSVEISSRKVQVMDVAFPDKESAVTYLASLSIEEFRREVHGVRSCALGKCMKSLGREKFYGKRHGRRHHASLNVMSPAALLCICRMHHVTTANQLVQFAEQLYGASALPRLVHFESSVSLLSRFNAEDMLTGLIESVMQVVSAIAVSTSMVKDLVKSLLDVVANAPTEHAFEEVLTEVAATMGMLDHDGPLTSEQTAELVQKATEQSTTEIGQWLHLHMPNEIWERLGDWLRLHMDSLSGFASVADDVLPWFPVMLGMKRAVVDKDIIGATLPVVVHWGLPGIMALVGAGPPCLLVSIALTSLCRMLPGFIRNQLLPGCKSTRGPTRTQRRHPLPQSPNLHLDVTGGAPKPILTHSQESSTRKAIDAIAPRLEGEMKKLGLQGIPDRGAIETAYWQFGHRWGAQIK